MSVRRGRCILSSVAVGGSAAGSLNVSLRSERRCRLMMLLCWCHAERLIGNGSDGGGSTGCIGV